MTTGGGEVAGAFRGRMSGLPGAYDQSRIAVLWVAD